MPYTGVVGRADALGQDAAQAVHAPARDDLVDEDADEQDGQTRGSFHVFLLLPMAIDVAGMGPLIMRFRRWRMGFVIPQVAKMPHKDRKVVAVGLTKILKGSRVMLSEPASRSWCVPLVSHSHSLTHSSAKANGVYGPR